jgi:hypothetical protein
MWEDAGVAYPSICVEQWLLTSFSDDPSYGFGDPILNLNYIF